MFQVLIVGASVGGLATALQLHHRGVSTFQVIDAASSSATATAGRAVGLWTNAWQVLDALGIGDQVRQACPWNSTEFWVHDLHADDVSARTSLRCFSLPRDQEFRRVPIKALTETLAASIPPERLHYGTSLDRWLQQREGERGTPSGRGARTDLDEVFFIVGADGARSTVRSRLLGCGQPLRHAGYVAHTGIACLPCRTLFRQDFREVDTLQELSCPGRVTLLLGRGDGTRLGVQRIDKQTVFWFFCENVRSSGKDEPQESLPLQRGNETKQRVWAVLSRSLPTPHGALWNALEQLVECTPAAAASTYVCGDLFPPIMEGISVLNAAPVALVGDAAHPMTPNLSQGAGLALEDAWTLANLLADQWTIQGGAAVEDFEQLGLRIRQAYRKRRYWRASLLSLRSRLTGGVLQKQLSSTVLVTLRNRILLPLALQPQLFVSHARTRRFTV